ncbi:MAG: response regulator transcription factor, partial [Desulfobacula sp.]
AGVAGYCLKDSSQDELLRAVYVTLSGKTYISPGIADKVMQGYIEGKKTLKEETTWDTLTQREKEVLKLVGEGHTSKEVAEFLCISPKTVERHRANMMGKLGLHNVSELTTYAIDKGLIGR